MTVLRVLASRLIVRSGERPTQIVVDGAWCCLLRTRKTLFYSSTGKRTFHFLLLFLFSLKVYAAVARKESVPIVFVEADGTEKEVMAEIGKNLLDVAHDNNVELEGVYISTLFVLLIIWFFDGFCVCSSQVLAVASWPVRHVI